MRANQKIYNQPGDNFFSIKKETHHLPLVKRTGLDKIGIRYVYYDDAGQHCFIFGIFK